MELHLSSSTEKEQAFSQVEQLIGTLAISINSKDDKRPWGGFFVIDGSDTERFAEQFFPDKTLAELQKYGEHISPKLLLVAPGEKLSWQYHFRRAELWQVVHGPVGVITSDTDQQTPEQILNEGEQVSFAAEKRHRLIGLDNWGVVAEIWQHTDENSPSDESDIVRLEDAYGR